jgi:hypothetical protein
MWATFGNPVFPMLNNLFRSSFAPAVPTMDTTFLPRDWTGVVTYPWHWLVGDTTPGSELPMVDRRYPVALIAAVLIGIIGARRDRRDVRHDVGLLIASFALVTYLVWLFAFGILRYLVTIELLSGVLLLATLRLLPAANVRFIPVVMIAAAFMLSITTQHATWGRAPFTADWFGVQGITAVHRPGTVYALPGDTPLGFLIHSFPDDARFVRLGGTFPLSTNDRLGARASDMIRAAPFVQSLAEMPNNPGDIATLRRFGLTIRLDRCRSIKTKTATVKSCTLALLTAPTRSH